MQSSHKNTYRTKHDGIFSKVIAKQWVVGNALYGQAGGESNTQIWIKNTLNIRNIY